MVSHPGSSSNKPGGGGTTGIHHTKNYTLSHMSSQSSARNLTPIVETGL